MNSLELRQLRYFHALSEELHFGRAAARERIGQPALSLQISQLERELGVRLFERTSRHVRLTGPGTILVERVRLVLQDVEALLSVADLVAKGGQDSIRIACILDCGCYRDVIDALDSFRCRRDDVKLDIRSDHECMILERLRRGTLDVGITWLPPTLPEYLNAAGLASERVVAALTVNHHLAQQEFLTAEMVASEPLVFPPKELTPSFWNILLGQLSGSAGAVPRVVRTEPSHLGIVQAVGRGRGIALLPESLASCLNVDGVKYLPCDQPQLSINLGVLWRDESPPLVRSLVDHLRKERRRTQVHYISERAAQS